MLQGRTKSGEENTTIFLIRKDHLKVGDCQNNKFEYL